VLSKEPFLYVCRVNYLRGLIHVEFADYSPFIIIYFLCVPVSQGVIAPLLDFIRMLKPSLITIGRNCNSQYRSCLCEYWSF
jgi:hypothetical protein